MIDKKPGADGKAVSLDPLPFEEALDDLLAVKVDRAQIRKPKRGKTPEPKKDSR